MDPAEAAAAAAAAAPAAAIAPQPQNLDGWAAAVNRRLTEFDTELTHLRAFARDKGSDRFLRLASDLKFYGDPKTCTDKFVYWLNDVNTSYGICEITRDDDRLRLVPLLLKEHASVWWSQLTPKPTTWADFEAKARAQFQSAMRIDKLRDDLQRMSQKGTAAAYASKFLTTANLLTTMSEQDKIAYFMRGLREAVRVPVALKQPDTLKKAADLATLIDDVVNHMTSLPNGAPPAAAPMAALAPAPPGTPDLYSAPAPAASGPVPMQLGTIALRRKITPEEKAELLRTGGCFYCRQPGHRAADCPTKRPPGA
jgi:hypothetical protein